MALSATNGAPSWWAVGQAHLAGADPVMAKLIRAHPGHLVGRGKPFESLLRAIVGQQISVLAADAVWRKFNAAVGPNLVPARVLQLDAPTLRACGLSGQKSRYITGIAQGFADGTVHPGLWHTMPDDQVIDELTKLPGIGRWTAEMFLLFHLLRPNVLPLGDLGLLKGYVKVYGEQEEVSGNLTKSQLKLAHQPPAPWRPVAADVLKRSVHWAPYCSLATWYLWRVLDPLVVEY